MIYYVSFNKAQELIKFIKTTLKTVGKIPKEYKGLRLVEAKTKDNTEVIITI